MCIKLHIPGLRSTFGRGLEFPCWIFWILHYFQPWLGGNGMLPRTSCCVIRAVFILKGGNRIDPWPLLYWDVLQSFPTWKIFVLFFHLGEALLRPPGHCENFLIVFGLENYLSVTPNFTDWGLLWEMTTSLFLFQISRRWLCHWTTFLEDWKKTALTDGPDFLPI